MTLSLLLILCLSGCGRKEASLGTESTAITETSDAAAETTENDPSDGEAVWDLLIEVSERFLCENTPAESCPPGVFL